MPGIDDSQIHISDASKRNIDVTKVFSIAEMQNLICGMVGKLGPEEFINNTCLRLWNHITRGE